MGSETADQSHFFFILKMLFLGQEQLGYMQGGKAKDIRDEQSGMWGAREKLNTNIGDLGMFGIKTTGYKDNHISFN